MDEQNRAVREAFGATISDMELAYKYAPSEVHKIVEHLKDPEYLDDDSFRYAFFIGKPGVGKSTLAKAVAFKSEWMPEYFVPSDFEEKGRNATSHKLIGKLNSITGKNVETVVILDELNQLLEHYNNDHYDTDATSKALWTFLDKQEGNNRFFLIGIMNRADKLPPQVKSRMLAQSILIDAPQNPEFRKDLFLSKLITSRVKLSKDANEYIDKNIGSMGEYSGRDFKKFALAAKMQAVGPKKEDCIVIDKGHLEKAYQYIENVKKVIKPHQEDKTSEEVQRELHKETLDQQKKFHEETMKQQRIFHEDNRRVQQQHFVQQQFMHKHLSTSLISYQNTDSREGWSHSKTYSELPESKAKEYEAFFTPEQIQSSKESISKYENEQRDQKRKYEEEEKRKAESSCIVM